MGGFDEGKFAPILRPGEGIQRYMDPIPPDIILTSIVISFGVTAFLLVVLYLTYRENGISDVREL